jgi:predicted TPR repeat methyltransferase
MAKGRPPRGFQNQAHAGSGGLQPLHASALAARLQQALAFHRRGDLGQAEVVYREVLGIVPGHFDALHMLGVLEAQRNNPAAAVELIGRALKIDSGNAAAHNNRGNALRRLKRHKDALASFDRALALKPDYPEALNNRGNVLRDLDRPADALASYDRALAIKPDNAEVLTNRGNALCDLKRWGDALASFDRALSLRPDNPEVLNNRGNALRDLKRHGEALASFDQALALRPDCADTHYNRGNALRDLDRYGDAVASYDRALALKPDYAEALNNRGSALSDLMRLEDALASFDRALAVRTDYPEALVNRGHVLNALKRPDDAIASYRAALAYGGDPDLIRYYLSALGAEPPPSSPPRSYVEGLFDQYATRFDRALSDLRYDIPRQLFGAVVAIRPDGGRDIADIGCGTGMCGEVFRRLARTLVGVDLAANMIEMATARGVYDRLVRSDLNDFLGAHIGSFDLVIAADVFVYIGDIDAAFAATRAALRPQGQFAFSVEAFDGEGFVLRSSRRYAHSLGYLRALAERHGFVERASLPVSVRQQEGQDIPGFIAIFELGST